VFKNYFKTTLRNLWKNKTYSFINIAGLAIGTLCCIYILLYVKDQYSYDHHEKHAGDIYRITTSLNLTGDKHLTASASPPIAPAMKNDFPEVEQYTRIVSIGMMGAKQNLIRYGEKSFYETDADLVDSTFFDIFTHHFTSGSALHVLDEPYSVVLLKPLADKIFGNENPLGKMIGIDNSDGSHDYKVTGVVDESLGKSNIHANLFVAMNSGGLGAMVLGNQAWAGNNFTSSYVRLRPGADPVALEKKLPAFLNKYGAQQLKELGMEKQLHLQPIGTIHTTTGYETEPTRTVSPSFLYILLLIAALIQVIACINFMNLSTARASKRAKEVGVRKVIGARKTDLVKQFLGESFLLSLTGVLIALPLLVLAIPYLNQITEAHINFTFFRDYRLWLMLAGLVLTTGLIAGSYPAFYLSAFHAVKVIKGNFSNHASAAGIRRSLVVFQFVLSTVLIAGIIIIYSQLHYINRKDLGFDQSQKLIFSFYTEESQNKMTAFTDDLRPLAEVRTVSRSNNYMSQFVPRDHGVYLAGGNMASATDAKNMTTDEYFVKANGLTLLSGRDFRLYDTDKVLVNEALIRRLGLTADKAIGTRLYTQYQPDPETYVEIAGVLKDFNYNSLHEAVRPLMLIYGPDEGDLNKLTVATDTKDYGQLLSKIGTIWHKDLPDVPFTYAFLDQEVQKQYETEITLAKIINSFTLIAILISCLGLFGLAAFSAEQRNKEIGIRKVLGASVSGVAGLLSRDFLKLVGIAIVIATPVAWWAMDTWLHAFNYRITLKWWMFAEAGLIAVLIALFTVSFQAIKAAMASPVKSLRSE
jgi:putative ABC transport system permease protein